MIGDSCLLSTVLVGLSARCQFTGCANAALLRSLHGISSWFFQCCASARRLCSSIWQVFQHKTDKRFACRPRVLYDRVSGPTRPERVGFELSARFDEQENEFHRVRRLIADVQTGYMSQTAWPVVVMI